MSIVSRNRMTSIGIFVTMSLLAGALAFGVNVLLPVPRVAPPTWIRISENLCATYHREGTLALRADDGSTYWAQSWAFSETEFGGHRLSVRVVPTHDLAIVQIDGGYPWIVDGRPGVTLRGTRECAS